MTKTYLLHFRIFVKFQKQHNALTKLYLRKSISTTNSIQRTGIMIKNMIDTLAQTNNSLYLNIVPRKQINMISSVSLRYTNVKTVPDALSVHHVQKQKKEIKKKDITLRSG